MQIQDFVLVNPDKVDRALNGAPVGAEGSIVGGVGNGAYLQDGVWLRAGEPLSEKEVEELEKNILVEYDRLGGLIKKGEDRVKMGSFFDFKSKKPHVQPKIFFVYRVNGKTIEVPDGKELPGEVKAVRQLEEIAREEAIAAEVKAEEVKEAKKARVRRKL